MKRIFTKHKTSFHAPNVHYIRQEWSVLHCTDFSINPLKGPTKLCGTFSSCSFQIGSLWFTEPTSNCIMSVSAASNLLTCREERFVSVHCCRTMNSGTTIFLEWSQLHLISYDFHYILLVHYCPAFSSTLVTQIAFLQKPKLVKLM